VSEYLSENLEQERELGILSGMQIIRVKNMNHSQFVDDTIMLGGASIIIASRFKITLDSFLDASRGAVNNRRNISPQVMQAISQVFQFSLA
jgi:hypothetical protein